LLLLILPIGFAYVEETKLFNSGESYELNTKNITVHNIFSNAIRISVDDSQIETLAINETDRLKNVNITLNDILYISQNESYAELFIKVLQKNECYENFACDDGDDSTLDECNLDTNVCKNEEITSCDDNDGYCPLKCSKFSDNDCETVCNFDNDCDDDDPCTTDVCTGDSINNGRCLNELVTSCRGSDECCPYGCDYSTSFSDWRDLDCSKNNNCRVHEDCDDGLDYTNDHCVGNGILVEKTCLNTETSVCINNDGLCPEGCDDGIDSDCGNSSILVSNNYTCPTGDIKLENNLEFYCNGNIYIPQKIGNTLCNEDYECRLGSCNEGKCLSQSDIADRQTNYYAGVAFSVFIILSGIWVFFLHRLKSHNKNL
jgi:hypothetical protein